MSRCSLVLLMIASALSLVMSPCFTHIFTGPAVSTCERVSNDTPSNSVSSTREPNRPTTWIHTHMYAAHNHKHSQRICIVRLLQRQPCVMQCVTVHQYLNGHAPPMLSDYCVSVADADTRTHLHCANHQSLTVPHFWLNTYGCRAFQLPELWYGLELSLEFHPEIDEQCRLLQTFA